MDETGDHMDYTQFKGFNYQPSWGSTGFEIWRSFDGERMGHDVALGKAYFTGMNAIRLWRLYRLT
jgi:hypothetical protein